MLGVRIRAGVRRICSIGAISISISIAACGSGSGSSEPPGNGGSGGSGGSGAVGGSGAGGSGGLGGSGVYGNVCAAVEGLSCWTADCETIAQGNLEQANARGCTDALVAAFQCYEDHPPTCEAQSGFKPDPECDAPVGTYNACLQGSGSCTMGGFLTGCVVLCGSTWGAECNVGAGNSYWDCHCRVGPKLGTSFTLPTVDKCDETLSADACAP